MIYIVINGFIYISFKFRLFIKRAPELSRFSFYLIASCQLRLNYEF